MNLRQKLLSFVLKCEKGLKSAIFTQFYGFLEWVFIFFWAAIAKRRQCLSKSDQSGLLFATHVATARKLRVLRLEMPKMSKRDP